MIMMIESKSLVPSSHNMKKNPYLGVFKHEGKEERCGSHNTPDLAFTAVNKKRQSFDLAPYQCGRPDVVHVGNCQTGQT